MIEHYSFGNITINGKNYEDIKIKDDKIIPWHYIEHHTVTEQDITELIDGIDILVIGTGASGLVKVKEEVLDLAKQKDVAIIIKPTAEACKCFNELSNNKRVAAILHSTC
jgi:hypothetical protein